MTLETTGVHTYKIRKVEWLEWHWVVTSVADGYERIAREGTTMTRKGAIHAAQREIRLIKRVEKHYGDYARSRYKDGWESPDG